MYINDLWRLVKYFIDVVFIKYCLHNCQKMCDQFFKRNVPTDFHRANDLAKSKVIVEKFWVEKRIFSTQTNLLIEVAVVCFRGVM